MTFKFILKNGGWWLKIATLEEYYEYRYLTDNAKYGAILEDLLSVADGKHETKTATTCILLENEKYRGSKSALELVTDFSERVTNCQLEYLLKGYYLLFNNVGGWHFDNNSNYRWITKQELVFPKYKETDIKIEKFPDGNHYYAYIGMTQVRDKDILKWNTYEEAYKKALEYIN